MADFASDVIVIGGGPAGAAAARLLAAWGRDVVLLTNAAAASTSLAESLPPSCRKLFVALDVLAEIDAAGFITSRGNSSAWGAGPLRHEPFQGETGWQVMRRDLDALLLQAAVRAGARVHAGVRVTRVEQNDPGAAHEGVVHTDGVDNQQTWRARWVLDCSGRAGVVARTGHRTRDASPPTVALIGVWRNDGGWPLEDASHTLIESYHDGWAWSVPVAADTRYVAAMVDPRRTQLERRHGAAALYRAELAKTTHLQQALRGASMRGHSWACSAVTYHAQQYAGPGWLLVGDAGSFLDPLSSAGVKKALASAYLAAVTVHTCLNRAAMQEHALQLFEQRERTAHTHSSALAARYYADAALHHRHEFWRTRAAASAALVDHAEVDVERDPRVRHAFEQLRTDEAARLRPSARCERVQRPTVHGREVVLEEHLITASAPRGVRIFRGVDLPALFAVAAEHERVPDLYEAYSRVRAPVRLPDFVGAVSALVAFGMLERTGTVQASNLEQA